MIKLSTTHYFKRKAGLLLAIASLSVTCSNAQVILNPAGDGGFETGTTFAANGWSTANGTPTTRVWYCGTGAAGFTGVRSGFIGNNITTVGNNGSARLVHLYKSIAIPGGATNIQVSFKYKQSATDETYDYLTVHATTATPVVSTDAPGLLITVDPGTAVPYSAYTTVNTTIPNSAAGTTVNLVFSFHSDAVTPNGQGAIDDVSVTYTPGPPCTGTPSAGTISGIVGPVCATDNFTLNLTGSTSATGITVQWQSSADGVTYANTGTNSATLSTTQPAATYYRAIVACTASASSDTTEPILINSSVTCYCAASATNTSTIFEKISNVSLGTLNNSSTSFGGYENFTNQYTDLAKGVAQNITVSIVNGYEFDQAVAFIDYNRNGVFTDAGEAIFTSAVGAGPYTASFTVPITVTNGPTRMRIRMFDSSDGANLTPCGTSTYGQVEDYTVNIVCPVIAAPAAAGATICANTTAPLTAASAFSGSTLTWYDAMSAGTAQGTGSPFATSSLATTTTYYVGESFTGCAGPRTAVTVTVSPVPTADAGADQAVCAGEATTLTATGTGTFSWDNGVMQAAPFTPTATTTYTVTVDNGTCTATDAVTVTVNDLPTADAGTDQSVCAGTAVALTATGTGTFSWDNGVMQAMPFTPTATTTYTVTVDNGNCTATDAVTVTVNELPAADAGADQSVCAGTAVALTATGAGTFSWDNGVMQATPFTPTVTTTYTVTVDNGDCTNTDEVTVTVNDIPTADAGADQTICAGEATALTATGTGAFSWDNGVMQAAPFTPAATTTYTVTVDNGSCTATDAVTVTVNELPTANAGSDQEICMGESVTLTATGTGTFSWDNGVSQAAPFTPTATMTYTVTVDNGNCTATDAVTVTVNAVPTAAATLSGVATLTATPSGQAYQWINCGTNTAISGQSTATFTATANGSYAVVVTNASGCSDTSACMSVTTLGINEAAALEGIAFFPNPTTGKVSIAMPAAVMGTLSVFDAQGKLVLETSLVENGSSFDLSNTEPGVYMVRIATANGTAMSRLIRN